MFKYGFIQRKVFASIKNLLIKDNILLFAIFFLALFLRTINLSTLPHSFHTDELVSGYVGRFVLQNGKDVYGNFSPLFYFDKFGDFRVILPMYISGVSTFLFGVNEFAVRFPAAFFGALMVFSVFAFARFLLPSEKIPAFFASFAVAVLPWHIVLSRTTSEGIIGLTVFCFATTFLLKAISRKKRQFLIISCLLFASTYFMYPSFRVITPLFLLSLPLLFPNKINKTFVLVFIFSFFAFTFFISMTDWGKGRFEQTSLLTNKQVAEQVKAKNEAFAFDEGHNSAALARIFHNKTTGYAKVFIEHYMEYFSPQFLFLKGGLPDRYVVQDVGLIFITFSILLFGVLLPVNLNMNKKLFLSLVFLLVISPLPSAVTMDDIPNVHRALVMIFPFSVLIGVGFLKIYKLAEKISFKIPIVALFFLLFLVEFVYFAHQYSNHTASYKSFFRNDGFKELVLYVKENKNSYQKIYMPGFETLPMYYLFYTDDFKGKYAGKFKKEREAMIDHIDNIVFIRDWCPTKIMSKEEFATNTLIIENGDCEVPSHYKEIKRIVRSDSTIAFKIIVSAKEN